MGRGSAHVGDAEHDPSCCFGPECFLNPLPLNGLSGDDGSVEVA